MMFQRGEPAPSDPWLGNFYGLAMPLVKRGVPVAPVQLENVLITNYLRSFKILLLSYDGQKPLSPEVHAPLTDWVRRGGVLVVCDADADPYLKVRDWWNSDGRSYTTPREHLFELLGLPSKPGANEFQSVGSGGVIWLPERPANLTTSAEGAEKVVAVTKRAAKSIGLDWRESNYLLLRRGPYLVTAGIEESMAGDPKVLRGRFVDLFDPTLQVQKSISITPASRRFLLDVDAARVGQTHLLASACKAVLKEQTPVHTIFSVEGVKGTPAVMLLESPDRPQTVTLAGKTLASFEYSPGEKLLWIHFENEAFPRHLDIKY
jgi:hypothetical protein